MTIRSAEEKAVEVLEEYKCLCLGTKVEPVTAALTQINNLKASALTEDEYDYWVEVGELILSKN